MLPHYIQDLIRTVWPRQSEVIRVPVSGQRSCTQLFGCVGIS